MKDVPSLRKIGYFSFEALFEARLFVSYALRSYSQAPYSGTEVHWNSDTVQNKV